MFENVSPKAISGRKKPSTLDRGKPLRQLRQTARPRYGYRCEPCQICENVLAKEGREGVQISVST